jgi:hypothetical protein
MRGITLVAVSALISTMAACTPIPQSRQPTIRLSQLPAGTSGHGLPVKPCLVGTPRCLSVDQALPRPCLVSAGHCSTDGLAVIDAALHPR